ncbi:prolipoprotein diacylglyceryl transferase [Hymenobacter puniceus]|uniref:prolipoprotein diacylglyceryl transferase n=1 Tax=Hymenobacter sp. BT190 TaxID=2763505 RepID=UPI001650F223|nr:prolipoprotein diacylglyceryl transferase family protein [Hymenobacter sp. BT190]MBC6699232.1 prolipoprotein diacylglyceryl transferase [Hymenobacter sp. BT190]
MLCTLTLPLPSAVGHTYYTLFYLLAFAVQLVLLLRAGYRRGYPMRTWLIVLACTTLLFILGTKLLALSGTEWRTLLSTGHWPDFGARTVLGGAIAGGLTLMTLRRVFGFSRHLYDVFAVPMCAGLAVQCLGCLLAGCCFGIPTNSGDWGLTYRPGTLPYIAQIAHGWLPAGAAHSLALHPTQLYSLVLCVAVGALLLATRRHPWPAGSRLWLQTGLLLAGRFIIECWRDPFGEPVGATMRTFGGVSLLELQWALLVLASAVLGWWLWQVRRARHQQPEPELLPQPRSILTMLVIVGLLLVTAWLGPHTLALPEVLLVQALLLAVLVLEAASWLLRAGFAAQPARFALPVGLACVVLVLTSQILPPDSARREQYYTISAGVSRGSFERLQNREDDCGGSSELLPYEHQYTVGTLDISRTQLPGTDRKGRQHKSEMTSGIRLHVGTDQQDGMVPDSLTALIYPSFRRSTPIVAVNPYFSAERRYFGLGMGVAFGTLGYHLGRSGNDVSVADVHASLRLGPRELVYAQADYNYMVYGTGNPPLRLGLGTGLGGTRWQLVGGATLARHYDLLPGASRWAGFAEAKGQLTPQWGASAYLTLGNDTQKQVGLRLSHRLKN